MTLSDYDALARLTELANQNADASATVWVVQALMHEQTRYDTIVCPHRLLSLLQAPDVFDIRLSELGAWVSVSAAWLGCSLCDPTGRVRLDAQVAMPGNAACMLLKVLPRSPVRLHLGTKCCADGLSCPRQLERWQELGVDRRGVRVPAPYRKLVLEARLCVDSDHWEDTFHELQRVSVRDTDLAFQTTQIFDALVQETTVAVDCPKYVDEAAFGAWTPVEQIQYLYATWGVLERPRALMRRVCTSSPPRWLCKRIFRIVSSETTCKALSTRSFLALPEPSLQRLTQVPSRWLPGELTLLVLTFLGPHGCLHLSQTSKAWSQCLDEAWILVFRHCYGAVSLDDVFYGPGLLRVDWKRSALVRERSVALHLSKLLTLVLECPVFVFEFDGTTGWVRLRGEVFIFKQEDGFIKVTDWHFLPRQMVDDVLQTLRVAVKSK